MLAFANVVHLLTYEFARLSRRRFPFASVLSCSLDCLLFWHVSSRCGCCGYLHIASRDGLRSKLAARARPQDANRDDSTHRKKMSKPSGQHRAGKGSRWSGAVTKHSNALDLDRGVFTWKDPRRIARSLKRSAETSKRRKSPPYRSAMSMLTFYINRAGKDLPASRKKVLSQAKEELRKLYEKKRTRRSQR